MNKESVGSSASRLVTGIQVVLTTLKVNVSIPVPDPYPCPTIAPISDSSHLFVHMLVSIPKGAINANA
jgi:hypothetical protein